MPKHVNSFAAATFSSIVVSLATVALDVDAPALAGDSCIEQPRPVYTTAALHWESRYDRNRGRTCWVLRDAYGSDLTEAYVTNTAPAPISTMWSGLTSWFGNFDFMRAAPESDAPQITPPAPDPSPKYQADTANAKKTESGVRVGQKGSGEAHGARRDPPQASISPDDRALFKEFLQWRERRETLDTLTPSSASTRQ